jgi:hypothetical protein
MFALVQQVPRPISFGRLYHVFRYWLVIGRARPIDRPFLPAVPRIPPVARRTDPRLHTCRPMASHALLPLRMPEIVAHILFALVPNGHSGPAGVISRATGARHVGRTFPSKVAFGLTGPSWFSVQRDQLHVDPVGAGYRVPHARLHHWAPPTGGHQLFLRLVPCSSHRPDLLPLSPLHPEMSMFVLQRSCLGCWVLHGCQAGRIECIKELAPLKFSLDCAFSRSSHHCDRRSGMGLCAS